MIVIDALWLGFVAKNLYASEYRLAGFELEPSPKGVVAGLIVYLFMAYGLQRWCVNASKPVKEAFLLGLTIYAVYNATLSFVEPQLPLKIALVDTLWGGSLWAMVSWINLRLTRSKLQT